MKRIFLAIIILGLGAASLCWSRQGTEGFRRELAAQNTALTSQKRQLTQWRSEREELTGRIVSTKELLSALPQPDSADALARKILSGATWKNLSAAESERLLAELGFNWNTSGEFLFISKKSLDGIQYNGLKGSQLTKAALETLAITPEEKSSIEAMARRLGESQATWVKQNLQRIEPHDNVLAEYSLPVDPDFSRNQKADFTNVLVSALGSQRAEWLQNHSGNWMQDMGLREEPDISKIPAVYLASFLANNQQSKPTKLKLERYKSGNEWNLNYTLEQANSSMTTSVNPWQPFPEAFRAIFPGGWQELAEREGFELPKSFDKK
jgi:hypothetical protein